MNLWYGLSIVFILPLLNAVSVSAYPVDNLPRLSLSRPDPVIEHKGEDLPSTPTILKRDWPGDSYLFPDTLDIGSGWALQFYDLDLIAPPIGPALAELVQFYASILYIGRNEWGNQPARAYREATLGSIKLVFSSNEPIAWAWIQDFLSDAVRLLYFDSESFPWYLLTICNRLISCIMWLGEVC